MKCLCCLILINFSLLVHCQMTVVTYNLWNIMFNWDVRKYRIARLLRATDADVIALQEVRCRPDGTGQYHEIISLLPRYKYFTFAAAHEVNFETQFYKPYAEVEGIAVFSLHPITYQAVQNLSHTSGPDKNRRIVLHVGIDHPRAGNLLVSLVHFSYEKRQQCTNMIELLQHIRGVEEQPFIILGDFNTYNNYEWPVRLLTQRTPVRNKQQCLLPRDKELLGLVGTFQDVWKSTHGEDEKGLTFSNMPQPGMESRPDRIFVSKHFQVLSSSLGGDGKEYKNNFFVNIIWHRVWSVLGVMYASQTGREGRTCVHDCGPHASCRCAVCVSGGDNKSCLIPNCSECDSSMFKTFVIFCGVFVVIILHVIYAALLVLQGMNNRSHQNCLNLAICDWFCLCDANLCLRPPKHKTLGRIYRLPPMVLLMLSLFVFFILFEFFLVTFNDVIDDIYAVIPEELYPSDHLVLSTTLKVVNES